MSGITITGSVTIDSGVTLGGVPTPAPTLMLSLDAQDYSGSGSTWTAAVGSNATLVNSPTYTAASPTYFSFDPTSSEYAITPALSSLSTWTLEAWFRPTSSLSSQITTVVGDAINSSNINFAIAINPGGENTGITQGAFFNNAGWHTTSGFVPTTNDWYQVVVTYDGSTIKEYRNGTLQSSTSYSGASTTDGSEIRIAARWDTLVGSVNYFPGDIAIVKIYDGDIGSAGVTTNWDANKTRFGLGGTPGVDNVTGYNEMNPPVTAGGQLEDGTATINGSTGFTINDDGATGVAIPGLTASNQTWFHANYPSGFGTKTCTWGPGSTVASSTINVVSNSGSTLVFFIQGQTGPATYNYPFTFS